MSKELNLTFPIAPVSYNNAYINRPSKGAKGRFLSREASIFKSNIAEIIQPQILKQGFPKFNHEHEYVQVIYLFSRPNIITKSGSVAKSRHDWDGFVKLFQDTVFRCLNIDDSFILDAKVFKRHSENPIIKAKIIIKQLSELIDCSAHFI